MKTNHRTKILALAMIAAALVAGCASDNHTGAVGDENETGTIVGSSYPTQNAAPPAPNAPTGANGSIGPGNPFGVGPGTGLDRAQSQ